MKTLCDVLLVKNGTTRDKPWQAIKGWNVLETTRKKWNKEKHPSWWATNDIDSHSVVLDSANFCLK